MSANAIAIRQAVAATRRACPDADVDGVAEYCIAREVPADLVRAVLFDLIVTTIAARPGEAAFRRAPLPAVLRAGRRRALKVSGLESRRLPSRLWTPMSLAPRLEVGGRRHGRQRQRGRRACRPHFHSRMRAN